MCICTIYIFIYIVRMRIACMNRSFPFYKCVFQHVPCDIACRYSVAFHNFPSPSPLHFNSFVCSTILPSRGSVPAAPIILFKGIRFFFLFSPLFFCFFFYLLFFLFTRFFYLHEETY